MTTATAVEAAEMRVAMTRKELVGRLLGYLLLAGAAVWFVANVVSAPSQTLNSLLFGVGNGALYALIALGYTLVYGIIELINFAHGDLFMLVDRVLRLHDGLLAGSRRPGSRRLGLHAPDARRRRWRSGRPSTSLIERVAYRRLRRAPKLASLITAVGMSFILQWVGPAVERLGTAAVAHGGAAGRHQLRRGDVAVHDHRRRRLHDPRPAAADLRGPADQAGQGDARHRPGPGRRAAHGDQRRPDHRLHVRHRRGDGGSGRPAVPRVDRDDPLRRRASSWV